MLTNQEMMVIMDDYGTYLTQLSYMYVKNWSTAEDIVQETFITYFKKHRSFKQKATLKTYLSQITINKSIDYLRSMKAHAKTFLSLIQGQTDQKVQASDVIIFERIVRSDLYRHVLTLKIKYREVIVLYYYENMTTVEIAQLLNLPEGTIRTRLKRGRDLLKDLMCDDVSEVFQID